MATRIRGRGIFYWAVPLLLFATVAHAQDSSILPIDPGRIVGGSTKQMREGVRPVNGFLPSPRLLRPGASGQAALVYINPAANFSSYSKVMVDPPVVWTSRDSQLNKVPQDQRRAVANTFYWNLYNALKDRCQLVRSPSPGTIRLRIALTDATTPNAAVNTVATFAPYASTAYSAASLAFNKGVGYFSGTASVEGYAVDAVKGTLLWEAVDKRGGTTALAANTLDNWRDVHHAFEAWSGQVAARFHQLGICR